jgi:uncharacterized damage-inducible protein DinB
MGERAEKLAERLEQVTEQVIAAARRCTEAQWQGMCADDGRAVGAVFDHVAGAYPAVGGWVRSIATGEALPQLTKEMIDQSNAERAGRHPAPGQQETIERLRRHGAEAAGMLRGLDDGQLDRTGEMPVFGGQPLSAEQVIRSVLIGHPRGHLKSIVATIGE